MDVDVDPTDSQLEEVRSEAENEEIRGNMRLRDRVKEIFKKHGLTAFSVYQQ